MNGDGGVLSVEEGHLQIRSPRSFEDTTAKLDFVQIFPQELSTKLFTYLSEKDLFSCAKCSFAWHEVINDNAQCFVLVLLTIICLIANFYNARKRKLRCIRRGWATTISDANLAQKWNNINSHCQNLVYKFRASPNFTHSEPEPASLRISHHCAWAVYFRQCRKIVQNWKTGIYVIHRLAENVIVNRPEDEFGIGSLNNDFDCNGKLLVVGTSSGRTLLWSVEGVPHFLTSMSLRRKIEVKSVILKSHFLIVLYQTGLTKVFDTRKLLNAGNRSENELNLAYAILGTAGHLNDSEFFLNVQPIHEDDVFEPGDDEDTNVEIYIRDLFRADLWFENEAIHDGTTINANETIVVLSGNKCTSFYWWKLDKGYSSVRQVRLSPGYQVICQCYLSPRKLYLSAQRYDDYGNGMNQPIFVFVYDLASLEEENCKNSESPAPANQIISEIQPQLMISVETMVEEIRSDSLDKRIVFVTQKGKVCSMELKVDGFVPLFAIATPSTIVDNLTVSDTLIVFHQCGFIVGINWSGEMLYEIEVQYGLAKGLQIFEDRFLVSGGIVMQSLCVWDAKTGDKLHTVYHQPCRIQHLYLDETKIITVGREDPPVVVAYW